MPVPLVIISVPDKPTFSMPFSSFSATKMLYRSFVLGLLAAFVISAALTHRPAFAADGVDTSPLPIKTVRAFPNLKPRRPVAIMGANDGKNRLFICSEFGQLLIIPDASNQQADETKTLLDIEDKVDYMEKENEE